MQHPAPLIEVRGLTLAFGAGESRVLALRGVDLQVAPGEFLAIMGSSGSGKSTLLHAMAGLVRPTQGQVLMGGRDLGALRDDDLARLRRRGIGVVFQAFNLLPVLTALENTALPLRVDGVAVEEAERRARVLLERVGVVHRADHLPAELSGGEQQRVAIARALVAQPALVLADEPTGNLDSENGRIVLDLLRSAAREGGAALVLVTHDDAEARIADRVVRIVDGRLAEPPA